MSGDVRADRRLRTILQRLPLSIGEAIFEDLDGPDAVEILRFRQPRR